MHRTIPFALTVAAAAAAFAGCGGGTDSSHISPGKAKASIERAAKVELVAQPLPAEAEDQGLRASYTNAATIAKDGQAVALFVLDDAKAAKEVKKLVRGSVHGKSHLIVKDEVLVVYAPAGKDRGAAVDKAVKAL
jgi:hypothetical protein